MRTEGLAIALRRLIITGLYALLLVPFVVSFSTTFPFVFGKAIAFRVIVELLTALWIASLLFDPASRPRRGLIFWALVANASVLLLTTFLGVDPHRSFWGDFERMSGVFNALHALLLPLIAASALRTERDWLRYWGWGLVTATVMAGIAIAQRFSGADIFGVHGGRVNATLGNSIYLGQYALFFLFIGWLVAVRTGSRSLRALAAFGAAAHLAVVLFTESRGALAGLLIGIAAFAFWRFIRPELAGARFRRPTLIVAAFGIAAILSAFFFGHRVKLLRAVPGVSSFTWQQLRSGGGTATRFIGWEIALEAFRVRPIAGWGPENYRFAFDYFFRPELLRYSFYETWFDHAHNGFLDILATEGILGALAAILLYGTAVIILSRTSRGSRAAALRSGLGFAALAAYLSQLVFVFDNIISLLLVALWYGWIARLEFGDAPSTAASRHERAPLTKGLIAVGGAAVSALLILRIAAPTARANAALLRIAAALEKKDFSEALAVRQQAMMIRTPYGRDLRKVIGRLILETLVKISGQEAQEKETLWRAGVADLRENTKRFPRETDDRYHLAELLIEGRSYEASALSQAEQAARDALPYSPLRQHLRFALARALLLENRPAEAVAALRETVALDPTVRESHWYLGLALTDAGAASEGYEEMKKALAFGFEPTAEGWTVLSNAAKERGDLSDAYWYAGLALRADGKLNEAYRMLGNAIAKGYHWKDSTDVFLLSYLARDVGEYRVAYDLIRNELGPWMQQLDPVEFDARLAEAAYRAGDYFTAYDAAHRAASALPRLRTRLAPMLIPGAATEK